jgi:hypothetical protein
MQNFTTAKCGQSAEEENISRYIVQKSYNGNDWNDLGEAAAKGSSNSCAYNDPLSGTLYNIYYRLNIQEVAGYSYSGVVALRMAASIGNTSVAPNPFKNNIQLSINSTGTEKITYALITSEGKQLRMTSQKLSRGSNVFSINDLDPGVCFLQAREDDQVKTIKLLKTDR